MNHRERIEATITGAQADRTPVMYSSHFPPEHTRGKAAVEAHVAYFERSGNDICKVMNENQQRGDYLVEAPSDLKHERLSDASREGMRQQAALVAEIKERVGADVPVLCTVHGPMVSVQHMSRRPGFFVENLDFYHTCIQEDPQALMTALDAAADGLCELTRLVLEAGADGIYLACLGAQRTLFTDEEYARIVQPYDLRVLEAAGASRFNILHICATNLAVERFKDYPVNIVNWEFGNNNLTMEEGFRVFGSEKTLLGGLDNHRGPLIDGTMEELETNVRDVLTRAQGHRFILGGGCTLPTGLDESRLAATVRFCENFRA